MKAPAIALMVIGIIAFVFVLFNIATELMRPAQNQAFFGQNPNDPAFIVGKWIGMLLALSYGPVVFIGGLQLKSLSNRVMIYIGVIYALLPCNLCCIFGMPFAIWSLIVLNSDDVKRYLDS